MQLHDANAYNDLGSRLLGRGRPQEALRCFQKAVGLDPGFTEAYYNLGLVFRAQGNPAAACRCFAQALSLRPDFAPALFVIGNMHLEKAEFARASAFFRKVIALEPDNAKAHYNLGNAALSLGDLTQASGCFAQALKIAPGCAEALNNLGLIHKDLGMLDHAVQCYQRALALNPGMPQALYNLGVALQLDGEFHQGLDHFRKALASDPGYAPARWLYDLSLPILYRTAEEIAPQRKRFEQNLERILQATPLATPEEVKRALAGVASTTHFFLQYQGQDDLLLQQKYGGFVQRVMAATFPQWSRPRQMPPLKPGERIRVGYATVFMHNHTVGQYLQGWLAAHDRNRFEIYGYHIGHTTDTLTEQIRQSVDVFHPIGKNLRAAASRIVADDLHILVYYDIGMSPLPTQLAALKLAPVQCTTWAHPITTGIPSVDYFLSSDLMEPEGAEAHYSETLVRLPNIALNYTPPPLPQYPLSREQLGLRRDAFVFLSSQSLFKYLPQHDDLYPRIAREVPNAQFVFIAHSRPGVTRQFEARLSAAFCAAGLRHEEFCRIQPRQGVDGFLSLNLASDALLDSLEWSGGRTTLEAIACGLPVVTLPGRFMRGRHTYAILKRMGVAETIASDKHAYVRIASELGRNREFAAAIRSQVAAGKEKLFADHTFMAALEAFYTRAVRHPDRILEAGR